MTSLPESEVPADVEVVTDDVVRLLVANHERFLGFVQKRVGSREEAEDLLQETFVRGLRHLDDVRDSGSITAWFYRMLRNAIIDHYRKNQVEARVLERVAAETEESVEPVDDELFSEVCDCISTLIPTLKPEYAEAVRRIDLEGMAVKDYAEQSGISANNAGVRLFRARDALKRQLQRACGTCTTHGCLNCTCKPATKSC
jgi:RNA polymerase sigma-70 factor (ECF subfamily)